MPTIPEVVREAALAAIAAAFLCAPLWAQDQPPPDTAQQQESEGAPADAEAEGAEEGAADGGEPGTAEDATEEGTAAEESADGTVADDSELDDQAYEGDDDVFVPSEEIPVDEPIPFPSDI
ncbi:MAG: hypothetical protein ACREQ1_07190 [Woeseiaceae bacterium]